MTADPRPQPSMYEGAGRCKDCGAAVGMRHDADCPNYPQPDAAPGETTTCEGWICEAHPHRHWPHDACAGPGMPCAHGPYGEDPPSAPATGTAQGILDGWSSLAIAAAQRQHAAEVADAEKFRAQLTEKFVRRGFQVGELQAALEAAQQEAAKLRSALALMWGTYENGEPLWSDPEHFDGDMGHAVRLSFEDEQRVLAALAATPPAATTEGQEACDYCDGTGVIGVERTMATHGANAYNGAGDVVEDEFPCPECQPPPAEQQHYEIGTFVVGGCTVVVDQPPPADADALREDA